MNDNYPIIITSQKYERVQYLKPTLPEKPKEPELKLVKKNWFEKLILWCDDYDDECINNQRKERYENQVKEYRIKLEEYHQTISKILSETELEIFRKKERTKAVVPYDFGSPITHNVRKGRFEDSFCELLRDAFGSKIRDDLEFLLPNGNAFVPDISYVDIESGLCIDIEIDEPYTVPEGLPIHYIGEDDYRNHYFSSKGWFVLRFAEEQIASYPFECLDFIKSFVKGVVEGVVPSFGNRIKRWTMSEAMHMANVKYRDSY